MRNRKILGLVFPFGFSSNKLFLRTEFFKQVSVHLLQVICPVASLLACRNILFCHQAARKLQLSQLVLSYSSCDKIWDKSNMRQKGFILAQFEGTWQLSPGAQSGSGEMRACCLVSLLSSLGPSVGWCHPHLGWVLLLQLTCQSTNTLLDTPSRVLMMVLSG